MLFDTLPNFFFSFSSITNDLTTLIAETFSSTTLFKSSYVLNTLFIIGCTRVSIKNKPIASIGIIIKNTSDNLGLIDIAKNNDIISISGVLTAILIIIWKAF